MSESLPSSRPRREGDELGPLLGPIIGYRAWELALGGQLKSLGYHGTSQESIDRRVWDGGEWVKAHCFWARDGLNHHEAPDPGCECGYYAHHRIRDTLIGKRIPNFGRIKEHPHATLLVGAIVARGRIAVHGYEGFRCEEARPIVIGTLSDKHGNRTKDFVDFIAKKWGVWHVVIPKQLDGSYDGSEVESMAHEFGAPISEDMLFH